MGDTVVHEVRPKQGEVGTHPLDKEVGSGVKLPRGWGVEVGKP